MVNMQNIKILPLLLMLITLQCSNKTSLPDQSTTKIPALKIGAEQLDILLPKLKNKNIGLVVNHTSMAGNTHLTDTLISRGITIKKVFDDKYHPKKSLIGNSSVGREPKK